MNNVIVTEKNKVKGNLQNKLITKYRGKRMNILINPPQNLPNQVFVSIPSKH